MELKTLITLLVLHYIGDFLLQTDWMATNKYKNVLPLVCHSIMYAFPFVILFNFLFLVIVMQTHFLIDFVSSKINHKLYESKKIHNFFCVIGFDQLVHYLTLIGIYKLVFYTA